MNPFIILIIGIVIGLGIAWLIKPPRKTVTLPNYNQQKKKESNKERVFEHLKEHDKASNDDIEELLGVSDATVTNYLNELEAEGSVKQVGNTGQGVYYKLS